MTITDKIFKSNFTILMLFSFCAGIINAQDLSTQVKTIRKFQIIYFEHTDSVEMCRELMWVKFNKAGDTIGYRIYDSKKSPHAPIYRIGNIRYKSSRTIVKEKEFRYRFSHRFRCPSGKKQYKRNLGNKLKKSKWIYDKNDSLLFYRYQNYNGHKVRNSNYRKHKTKIERNNQNKISSKESKSIYYKSKSYPKRRVKKFSVFEYNADGQLTKIAFPKDKNTYEVRETIYNHHPNDIIESYEVSKKNDTSHWRAYQYFITDSSKTQVDLIKKISRTYSIDGDLIGYYDSTKQEGFQKIFDSTGLHLRTIKNKNDSSYIELENTYNSLGLLISQIYSWGEYYFEYNENGDLKQEKQIMWNTITNKEYEYNDEGLLILIRNITTAKSYKSKYETLINYTFY